jgi:dTDP-4-dehydrorhamnose 3,5-epimerase
MIIRRLSLPEVFEIIPKRHRDERGYFSETYSEARFREAGIAIDWVQDNHSYSSQAGTLRGLHYQKPPAAQDKLVGVVRGAVFDVAVDIRRGSPTFAHSVSLILSAETGNQIMVPQGFAHGFLTLESDSEVLYKVSSPYSPLHDCNIRYDDPAIGIDWPLARKRPILSERDSNAKFLASQETGFVYASDREVEQ